MVMEMDWLRKKWNHQDELAKKAREEEAKKKGEEKKNDEESEEAIDQEDEQEKKDALRIFTVNNPALKIETLEQAEIWYRRWKK